MGSNRPKCVSVWFPLLIGEPCCKASQRNEGIVEKTLTDQFFSILKQIFRGLACFPILHKWLILWSDGLPCQNSLCRILRDRGPKFATVLVGWDPYIPEMFSRFQLDALFVNHFWRPFTPEAFQWQAANLIASAATRDPHERNRSHHRQGVHFLAWSGVLDHLCIEGASGPDELEPGLLLNVARIGLQLSSHILWGGQGVSRIPIDF